MARLPRFKVDGVAAWYHVRGQVTGNKTDRLLQNNGCQSKMIDMIKFYENAYYCKASALCIMGTHYHLIIKFLPFQEVSIAALKKRALFLYPSKEKQIETWNEKQWDKFRKRLFNLSEFMRNLQSGFARWYNDTFDRRGRFWGDRFKSSILADKKAQLDCMLYVDLNPVRAGIVERPEEYTGSSIYLRNNKQDEWLVPLDKILPINHINDKCKYTGKLLDDYRSRLYYRGSIPTKKGQAKISAQTLNNEIARGFNKPGIYRNKLRYFIDGIFIGNQAKVEKLIGKLTKVNDYITQKKPAIISDGKHQCLHMPRDIET